MPQQKLSAKSRLRKTNQGPRRQIWRASQAVKASKAWARKRATLQQISNPITIVMEASLLSGDRTLVASFCFRNVSSGWGNGFKVVTILWRASARGAQPPDRLAARGALFLGSPQ